MDPNTLKLLMGSAGAGAVTDKVYIEDIFSTYLYTGNGSTQTITNGIDLSGKGGLAWIKGRSDATGHRFTDTIRGATKSLESNSTAAEVTESTGLTSFSSTGFALGSDGDYNTSNSTYVSWTFRKAAKFFDVVTYTGNGANRTISHNLGSVPGTIFIKRTDSAADWQVYHRSLANTEYLVLNSAAAKATGATRWNSTTPTSTELSLGTDTTVNANGGTYVAYLFAHDAGGFGDSGNDNVISCGSLTIGSNGKATADLGWEPQYVLFKRTNNASNWYIVDNMRGIPVGSADPWLGPHLSDAESTAIGELVDPSATGFTLSQWANGDTIIYIAIRRGPMKTPTDATKVFSALTRTGTSATATISSLAFPTDATLIKTRTASLGYDWNFYDRLRGATKRLATNATASESTETNGLNNYASMVGYTLGSSGEVNSSSDNFVDFNFRRAPGFFDVVAYTGTGSALTVSHNLGVVPEFCILKRRNSAAFWPTWSSVFTSYQYVALNETSAKYDDGSSNQTFSFTSSDWSIGTTFASVNASGGTYIAYLFATCPGVSKVGSYTGSGTTKQIDCGFTNGARFVLIKRTDSTGDWYVWDTARGIVSGNDPFLLLNSTAAENTATDYIDPISTGFEISSTAPAAINASGGSYIYLSVA